MSDIQALREFDYDSDRVPTDLEEAIHRVLDRLEQAEQALVRVRELHRPESNARYEWCAGCSTDEYAEDYPCPTIRALEGDE